MLLGVELADADLRDGICPDKLLADSLRSECIPVDRYCCRTGRSILRDKSRAQYWIVSFRQLRLDPVKSVLKERIHGAVSAYPGHGRSVVEIQVIVQT